MEGRAFSLSKLADILVLGGIFFVLFLFLMPDVEESRNEARLAHTWNEVRRIRDSTPLPEFEVVSGERDIWGQPYRIQPLPDGTVRVVSAGPNGITNSLDTDDISSDMAESPVRPIKRAKHRQFLLAFGSTFGGWLLASLLIVRRARR
jgi:hypothetical protein